MAKDGVDCKVVLLGKENSGKTSLVARLLHNRFNGTPYQSTIGAAFGAKRFTVNNRSVTLGIWDTAGSEKYQAMSRIYYRGARAAIVCYDLTDKDSFERARLWVHELQEVEEHCKIYLCGTKLDLIQTEEQPRVVGQHECETYGQGIDASVFETSSKINHNVMELFQRIANEYDPMTDPSLYGVNVSDEDLSNRLQSNRKGCC